MNYCFQTSEASLDEISENVGYSSPEIVRFHYHCLKAGLKYPINM